MGLPSNRAVWRWRADAGRRASREAILFSARERARRLVRCWMPWSSVMSFLER